MDFLHNGIPMPTRKAVVVRDVARATRAVTSRSNGITGRVARATDAAATSCWQLLAHPNIASKHWIIRQYDHEVQGGSVIKPLIGPRAGRPVRRRRHPPEARLSYKGVAIACGLAPHIDDPYDMAHRRDRRSDPQRRRRRRRPGADRHPRQLLLAQRRRRARRWATLVRACEACHDAAHGVRHPVHQRQGLACTTSSPTSETGEVIRIPNTLLISAIGVIDDVRNA